VPSRLRLVCAGYLAAFFLAVAAAPHHHLDPIADIVSDGPSNSGSFTQISGPVGLDTGLYTGAMVDDESCLACFNRDFVASPAVVVALTHALARLPLHPLPPELAKPELVPAETSSRGPPSIA
jgi:hypothetical protein